jgi:hypothetical protein
MVGKQKVKGEGEKASHLTTPRHSPARLADYMGWSSGSFKTAPALQSQVFLRFRDEIRE